MVSINETGAISEILEIKNKIEQSLVELQEERAIIKQKIISIQDAKENMRKDKGKEFHRQYQLKIESLDTQKTVKVLVKSVDLVRQMLNKSEESIWKTVGLTAYGDYIKNIRFSVEGVINYYSEDSLRLELLKQTNINRDKRVELTRLTNEFETKQRELEEVKKEKERSIQLELERERQEQERRQRIDEEKIQAEKERQREQFLKQKFSPLVNLNIAPKPMPFQTTAFNTCSPEPESKPSFSSSGGLSSISESDNVQKTNGNGLPPLSQFTRW